MADVKISALPAATTPLSGAEILPIVQGGVTTQVSVTDLTAARTVEASTINVDANSAVAAVRITQTGSGSALVVEDESSPDSSPFVVNASGQVGIGVLGTSIPGAFALYAVSDGTTNTTIGHLRSGDSTGGPTYDFRKSRGTFAAPTSALSGDTVGNINFRAHDGTGFISAAQISVLVDGTSGTNDMPGRLTFSTTADGASAVTERMRIDSTGAVGIGTTTLGASYGLRVSKTLTADTGGNIFSSVSGSSGTPTNLYSIRSTINTVTNSGTPYTIAAAYAYAALQGTLNADSTITNQYGFDAGSSLTGATNNFGFRGSLVAGTGRWNFFAAGTANNAYAGNSRFGGTTVPVATVDVTGSVAATTTILSTGATSGIGYATGAGGAVTQGTSRTTGVTLNTVSGAITLFSAAGSAAYQSFTVTNSAVELTDTIIVNQRSGTDRYIILVTDVAAGSFEITFATTGGTTTEQPVFNFAVIKAVAA
jgi:hypothetical protein